MSAKWRDDLTDQLCEAFLLLDSTEEAYAFLEDVATIGEIKALSQRLEVARLLYEDNTYPQIAKNTGASTATISRVKKFLDYGTDGYKIVLDRMKEKMAEGMLKEVTAEPAKKTVKEAKEVKEVKAGRKKKEK